MPSSKEPVTLKFLEILGSALQNEYLVRYEVEIHPYPDTKIETRELRFEEKMTLDEAKKESSDKKEELSKFSKIKSWKLLRLEEVKA